jgi:thioredoxin reductase
MNESMWTLLVSVILLLIIFVPYVVHVKRSSKKQAKKRDHAIAMGADKPIAQHPRIDQSLCIGCSSCVIACPEGALGLICKVMVVGAGDAGVEATIGLSKQKGTVVSLINTGDSFPRAKPKNQERIKDKEANGLVTIHYNSQLKEIKDRSVIVVTPQGEREIENDFVFVFAGGEMPTPFLKKIGIEFTQKERVF